MRSLRDQSCGSARFLVAIAATVVAVQIQRPSKLIRAAKACKHQELYSTLGTASAGSLVPNGHLILEAADFRAARTPTHSKNSIYCLHLSRKWSVVVMAQMSPRKLRGSMLFSPRSVSKE